MTKPKKEQEKISKETKKKKQTQFEKDCQNQRMK